MSEDRTQETGSRKRRLQRRKKYRVLILSAYIMASMVLSVVLLSRVLELGRTVGQLTGQLEELKSQMALTVQGSAVIGEAERELSGGTVKTQDNVQEIGSQDNAPDISSQDIDTQEENGDTAFEETASHRVYLTFDDGPSANTEDILDILDSYNVKATFFVVGKEGEAARKIMQDIVDRGHTLGMHSYSHKYAELYASVEAFAEDFVKQRDYLEEVTGAVSTVYRFPGGSSNKVSELDMGEFADYLDSQKVRFFDWNISAGDGGSVLVPVETLVENVTETIPQKGTSVVLLHDSAEKKTTVEALPTILENILAMEDTVILPITEDTEPVQHIHR